VVVHIYNPSIWEAEARRLKAQDWPGLHSKVLSQKNQNQNKTKQKTSLLLLGRLRLGGSRFEASLGKQFSKPHLQKNQSKNELEVWINW
jgi:hypothetical protein